MFTQMIILNLLKKIIKTLTFFICHLALIHELLELGVKENRKSTQGKHFLPEFNFNL